MSMKRFLDITDFSREGLREILNLMSFLKTNTGTYSQELDKKVVANAFYKEDKNTEAAFTAAAVRMGGSTMNFSNSSNGSLKDDVTVMSSVSDVIVLSHSKKGAARAASLYSSVPIINAGDGGHNHPTQTLTDLLTIRREKGRLDKLTIGLCGDLKFGRTVHSLIKAMSRYEDIEFIMISPEELQIPEYIKKEVFEKKNIPYEEVRTMEEVMPRLDILYMTRVQRERFFNEADYIRLKDSFILDLEKLETAKKDLSILHPLPRVNEISVKVDDDPRACYFRQALNGKFVRMALIMKMLGVNA